MATLTAWKFPTTDGAGLALEKLEKLQGEALVQVYDAAVVTWEPGRQKPKTHELHSGSRIGALGGGFWGLLFGLIFFVPILGLAIGAGMGALLGSMRDVGISEQFISQVRQKVTPGTSALFALTGEAVMDRVAEEFSDTDAELVSTNLSAEQEAKLREAFGEEG
jgi:uncharacterized membrane protein